MFTKQKKYASLVIAFFLAVLAVTSVWAVTVVPWFWAGDVINVSNPYNVQANASVAAEAQKVNVVWAGGTGAFGIFLADLTPWGWSRTILTSTGTRIARFPDVVLNNGQALIAWSQSQSSISADSQVQNLLQQDGTSSANVVAGPIYGRVVPDMQLAPTGLHLVFPAATSQGSWSKTDLYYAHRYLTETTWSAPTVVVTHGQVVPAADLGKIWYPKLGVIPDGQTLHVVWQQDELNTGIETSKIWMISGTWQPGGVVWNTPAQISPPGQNNEVRPVIDIADSGIVHISWSELLLGSGGRSNPEAQYINYRQLVNPALTKVNVEPIKVNSSSPTWASSTIALHGEDLCIAWHGFFADTGETLEEITLRCSRNEGKTWLPLINVSDSPYLLSDFPVMAFDPEGYLHIAWEERALVGATYLPLDIFYRGGISHRPTIFIPLVVR